MLMWISIFIISIFPVSLLACDSLGTIKSKYNITVGTNTGIDCVIWADFDFSSQIDKLSSDQELAQALSEKCISEGTLLDKNENNYFLKIFRAIFKGEDDPETLFCRAKNLEVSIDKFHYRVVSDCSYRLVEEDIGQRIKEVKKVKILGNVCEQFHEENSIEESRDVNSQENTSKRIHDQKLRETAPTRIE